MVKPSLLMPREKLRLYGVQTLQFYELVAIILGSGNKQKDVLTLAQEIAQLLLKTKKRECLKMELEQLTGIGHVNQMKVLALYEMMDTWHTTKLINDTEKIIISTPEDTIRYFRPHFTKWNQEILLGLYLDTKSHVIACERLFVGTIDSVEIHPREIFSHALFKGAKSIILMHNHPSGNPEPSSADIKTTKILAEVGRTLGIPIMDHIIVTETDFKSLKRESYF